MLYLDHAATSYPKPASVAEAVQHWYADVGVSADRGDGPRTREAAKVVRQARQAIAAMTGHPEQRVAFNSGATEGCNLILRALLPAGSRVLTTAFEHSSVVRPLLALRSERDLDVEIVTEAVPDGPNEQAVCDAIVRDRPEVCVFTHASNVTGAVFDAARICAVAREHGTKTVLDVSQTAGYLPLDCGADVVIGSGHKAMHGPPGIGFVSVHEDLQLAPQKQGGTGSSVALEQHPETWPQAFEAGTPNTPAIFGLAAALRWLDQQEPARLLERSLERVAQLEQALTAREGFRLLAPGSAARTPVLSFVHESYDPLEIGAVLAQSNIHARAGFHCAPWIHEHLGTAAGGTVRLSPGPETTAAEIDTVLGVLDAL